MFQVVSALSTLWSRVEFLFLSLHFKPWISSVLYIIASKMATLNSSNVENSSIVYNPSVQMQALYIIMFLILESVGNFLLFCMITYEKYGMDSQKRTVTNQLLSNLCFCVILYNILIMPTVLIHRVFGPQGNHHSFGIHYRQKTGVICIIT